jgi:hypothetical protein
VSVDQERIGHISRNDRGVVNINIIDVVNDVDTLPLAGIRRLNDPNILLRVMLFKLLVVRIEVTKFVWQDVSVRYKVKVRLAEFLLHADHIVAEPVLSCYFVALREMIDLLELIQTFIKIALAAARAPQDVPLVRLSVTETICLEHGPQKLVIKSKHFE